MSGDPSHVSRAPVDLARVVVEGELEGGGRVHHVTCHRVEYTLRFPSGATVVISKLETNNINDNRTTTSMTTEPQHIKQK